MPVPDLQMATDLDLVTKQIVEQSEYEYLETLCLGMFRVLGSLSTCMSDILMTKECNIILYFGSANNITY